MSTYLERRAALAQNSTARGLWIAILVFQGAGILMTIIGWLGVTWLASGFGGVGGFFGLIIGIFMVVLLAIALLVFWGTYRLETWVMWLMWIEVLFSLPSLFSGKSLYQPVIYILTALIYTWIRQQVNQAIPASTPAVQPPTPPVTPPSMV